jgi:hypothetical protein
MRQAFLTALVLGTSLIGCGKSQSPTPATATNSAAHTVFTDSVLHVQKCETAKPGEDWHAVCTPKDQSLRIARPKNP